MRSKLIPALVLGAVLVMAGCGGSSSTTRSAAKPSTLPATATSGNTSPNTNHAFVASLNSLCNKANAAYAAAPQQAQASIIAHYLLAFHGLHAPAGLQPVYARYLGVLEQELADLRKGNSAGLSKLATTKAKPLAGQLGAKDCANPQG